MIKEWQLVEARRDASHEFKATEAFEAINCAVCGKPRWAHVHDGFRPGPTRSYLSMDVAATYRGPHPAFTRPGSFSKIERHELIREEKAKRAEIERVIAEDKAKFKAKGRG